MSDERLNVTAGAAGLTTLVTRAHALDAAGSARLRVRDGGSVDIFVSTPFDCLAARRVEGTASRDGAVVALGNLKQALTTGTDNIGPARDASWAGALPPAEGFIERDIVPVHVVRGLADDGRRLAKQFSGPLGPPRSLLDQNVLTADSGSGGGVDIPMRMIFTCTSLGLIPGAGAPADIPRHLRIATAGRWVRMDAPYGSVYHSTGLNLLF